MFEASFFYLFFNAISRILSTWLLIAAVFAASFIIASKCIFSTLTNSGGRNKASGIKFFTFNFLSVAFVFKAAW